MVSIFMITGDNSSNCGVSDYSRCLFDHMELSESKIFAFQSKNWGFFTLFKLLRKINLLQPKIIHIQYPTAVFGSSILPQLILIYAKFVRIPVIVTLHEFSQTHFLRKFASMPFALADSLVFTNEFERNFFLSMPFFGKIVKSEVIPLGSSIPVASDGPRDSKKVILFGLIRPNKGIEEFLELSDLSLRNGKKFRFLLIGNMQRGGEAYFDVIKTRVSEMVNVSLVSDLGSEQVSEILANSTFAYLHFPDGASDRRTSLISALGNGLVVITTCGSQTPVNLLSVVRFVSNPSEALSVLVRLIEDDSELESIRKNAQLYARKFSWEGVTAQHQNLYSRIVEPALRSGR